MRTLASLRVICSFDLDQQQKAFDQQVTFDDTDSTTASCVQSGLVILAPGATGQQYGFGGVTAADTLLVIAYDRVQIQLGSNAAPLVDVVPIPANSASAVTSPYQRESQAGVQFLRGKVSSLFLTNPSSTVPAEVFVAVVGNAL